MMSDTTSTESDEAVSCHDWRDTAILLTLSRLFAPVARLCLSRGITFAVAEEVLKRTFVQEGKVLQPGGAEHGMVSRISTATGINRREVTRLTRLKSDELATKQPYASELLAQWTTDQEYRDQNGPPVTLSRTGTAPSFESLAQKITRDVHPRSMLDELIRLGVVSHDEEADTVSLIRNDFVPARDFRQMLNFLGDNVGDHLDAAVTNVLHDGGRHQEQAVFADELSAESIATLRPLIAAHWQALRDAMVPVITELIAADRTAGRIQNQRVRVGLYSFDCSTSDSEIPKKCGVTRRFRKSTSKENIT